MSTPSSPRASLAELTAASGGLEQRWIWSADRETTVAALLKQARTWANFAGRRVLLTPPTQVGVAEGLLALDGRADRLVLCTPDTTPDRWPAIVQTAALDAVVAEWDRPRPAASASAINDAADTEWLMFTSGTTGEPKMVVHTLAGLTDPIGPPPVRDGGPPVWGTFYDIRRYGGLQILVRALLGAGSLVLSDAAEGVGDHLLRLGRHSVTHLSGTPSHWRRALMRPEIEAISPRYVRLSGEIADQALLDRLQAAFPAAQVAHAYASTEAGVGFEVDDGREGLPAALVDGGGSAEVAMRLVDGSLHLRSRRGALGYAHADAPPLGDADGFIDTGDLLERRGERLHFVGRREGVINVGGLKVHPEEVEAVIDRHPGVRMSYVHGRRSSFTGQVVVADVVPVEERMSASVEESLLLELTELCRSELPMYRRPIMITLRAELAMTEAGKLDRRRA